ncbi:MAG: hypothetical protein JNL45_10080 [Hyphomicrobium sp.]|jgi:hypothetical protein|nr:hypothetical protein [Hyphomicrobium sp.]
MPPLIVLAIAGAGLYAGYKLFAKLIEQAHTPAKSDAERWKREAAAHANEPKDLGGLEWDEQSGAYRPKKGA